METSVYLFFIVVICFLLYKSNKPNFNHYIEVYSYRKILKEINTLDNLWLRGPLHYYESNYTVWDSYNQVPYLAGRESYDVFITDKKYSQKMTDSGHCEVYDWYRLDNEHIYIGRNMLEKVRSKVTEEQFNELIAYLFKEAYANCRSETKVSDYMKTPTYSKKMFSNTFEKMEHILLNSSRSSYNELNSFLSDKVKTIVNKG